MTRAAQEAALQRVAPLVRFVRQLNAAVFADVAVDVEIFVHGHDSDRFFGALDWSNSVATRGALWCKHSGTKIITTVNKLFLTEIASEPVFFRSRTVLAGSLKVAKNFSVYFPQLGDPISEISNQNSKIVGISGTF